MNAVDMLKLCRAALNSRKEQERAAVAMVVDDFLRELEDIHAEAIRIECAERAIIQMGKFTADERGAWGESERKKFRKAMLEEIDGGN